MKIEIANVQQKYKFFGIRFYLKKINKSKVAQRKRAGPITQRSVDRNYALLDKCFFDDAMYFLKISLCTVDLCNVTSMVQW
jgi:hypothetical protein